MCRPLSNLTTTDDQGHILTYDAWNRLINVSNANGTAIESYAYDGTSRRIELAAPGTNPTEYYYDSSSQILEEDTGATGGMLHAQYVWSPVFVNALVLRDYNFTGASTFALNERVYLTQDAQWNTTGVIIHISGTSGDELPDSNGDGIVGFAETLLTAQNYGKTIPGGDAVGDFNHDGVVNFADELKASQDYGATTGTFTWVMAMHFGYTPYGLATGYSADFSSTAANFMAVSNLFEGGYQDQATGLIHFDMRDYDPRTYTWVTTDPLQLPPTFYDAFADNPINILDPSGLFGIPYAPNWLNNLFAFFETPAAVNVDTHVTPWFFDDPSFGGSLVPALGPFRKATYNFHAGNYKTGSAWVVLTAADVCTLGSLTFGRGGASAGIGSMKFLFTKASTMKATGAEFHVIWEVGGTFQHAIRIKQVMQVTSRSAELWFKPGAAHMLSLPILDSGAALGRSGDLAYNCFTAAVRAWSRGGGPEALWALSSRPVMGLVDLGTHPPASPWTPYIPPDLVNFTGPILPP